MKYNNLPPSSTALRRFSSVRLEIGVWDGHIKWKTKKSLSLFCCICEHIRNFYMDRNSIILIQGSCTDAYIWNSSFIYIHMHNCLYCICPHMKFVYDHVCNSWRILVSYTYMHLSSRSTFTFNTNLLQWHSITMNGTARYFHHILWLDTKQLP